MASVLSVVTEATSLSIPVEISAAIDAGTPSDVTLACFYCEGDPDIDPDVADFGLRIVPLGATGRFDVAAFRRLRRLISSGEFDIVHTHQNFLGSVTRLLAAPGDVAVVDTEHNDHTHFSWLQNAANAPTLSLSECVVANSRATQRSFRPYEKLLLRWTDQTVIYNGVDIDRIEDATLSVSLPSGPTVVTAGTLTEQKNHATLLEAFRAVLDEVPAASLVVVGDGPLAADLRERASRHGVRDRTTFTGFLPTREEVYGVMQASDVCCMPSWSEGFCVAAVEAMACGLPVVASDLAVFREVVGDAGRFVPPDDPDAIATSLVNLLTNGSTRDALATRARRIAREKYPLERTANAYHELFTDILSDD